MCKLSVHRGYRISKPIEKLLSNKYGPQRSKNAMLLCPKKSLKITLKYVQLQKRTLKI